MAMKENEWEAIEELEDIINTSPSGGVVVLSVLSNNFVHYSGSYNIYPYHNIETANQTIDYIQFNLNSTFGENPIFFYINYRRDTGYLNHCGNEFKELINSGTVLYNNSIILIVGPYYVSDIK